MTEPETDLRTRLMRAALVHVPFDGWSEAAFRAACADLGVDPALARAHCPRGAVDLALAFHAAGDAAMLVRLAETDLSALRFRDRVAAAIRFRLEAVEDREAVRRGAALFALPQHAADGAKAIWGTADAIWTALGDSSDDLNWYTKRASLSAVYASTVLYWLGDDSPGHQATWEFLDRRIEGVMAFEGAKARLRANPLTRPFMAGQDWLAARVHKPRGVEDLPGRMGGGRM
ncbi:COQ9 family protein [Ruixingdingia sedimenti]|uniref:COQ9 family protein n=1 Tax=Ruixingdingia sedimenti TaxID=3073604 RepID=A0ABU1F975_9RHOB|nr:COQ9 family protein [Xinfangfangia sp. LG-4]MDR5653421.1 COQ9 family protein [Xinfangfangia sp. LG-4]